MNIRKKIVIKENKYEKQYTTIYRKRKINTCLYLDYIWWGQKVNAFKKMGPFEI